MDSDGWIQEDFDIEFEMAERMRHDVAREWKDDYIERTCHICSSINLFVKVEPLTPEIRSLKVLAAKCPKCGLNIREQHRYLAEYHVGELTSEEIENFLKDVGE